ncbi:MAG: DUF5063 domain-containing protein [Muribaculaceae bacterium]|nr:DUF5063 domain-containing protein [Muribaculaceae bacterium]
MNFMEDSPKLSPNELAFIALANEYCEAIELALNQGEASALADKMLRMLPRIYIVTSDLPVTDDAWRESYIEPTLTEQRYDSVRDALSAVLAEDDVYLEVMVEDMKYSDTPIATSISENLADLYQEFYNFVNSIADLPTSMQQELVAACVDNFYQYWGQTLCNVTRALHFSFKTIK